VTQLRGFNNVVMPPLQPLVEDENERPDVEVIEALLGKRLKVCSCRVLHERLACIQYVAQADPPDTPTLASTN
jgi:hypothetical protein